MKDGYIKTILISFDQFIGSFIPGAYADETISSRAFREQWAIESFINIIFREVSDMQWLQKCLFLIKL